MKTKKLHNWDLSFADARSLQKRLREKIIIKPVKKKITRVGGLDCSISPDKSRLIAGVVVTEYGSDHILESQYSITSLDFPYVPGLLSFREGYGCIEAVKKLKTRPDVFVIDGQGIAHPQRLGLASHLGLFFDVPTVGCAKSRLIGEYGEFELKKGNFTDLTDNGDLIGRVVCSRSGVKPLFVSPGNRCDFEDSVKIVLDNAIRYRLPEPTRQGHLMVTRLKKEKFL